MTRNWTVIAVYAPTVKKVAYFDGKGRWSGLNEGSPSSRAGIEFKFTVAGASDEVAAVAAVIQSGYFLSGLSKEFGFQANETVGEAL